jgi:REP element-mobilizing transposase RayT
MMSFSRLLKKQRTFLKKLTRTESVQIVIDSLKYLQEHDSLKLYAYVILENHLHLIASSDDISLSMHKFKAFTAKKILELLREHNAKTILDQFAFYKKAYKDQTAFQIWQEGIQPKMIQSEQMMRERIDYIHLNPVKRGYVDEAVHWRYSSARNYEGNEGMIEIERGW